MSENLNYLDSFRAAQFLELTAGCSGTHWRSNGIALAMVAALTKWVAILVAGEPESAWPGLE